MDTRERKREETRPAVPEENGCPQENPAQDQLRSLQGDTTELLAAADRIISNTLSTDSEGFLDASRQRGGE